MNTEVWDTHRHCTHKHTRQRDRQTDRKTHTHTHTHTHTQVYEPHHPPPPAARHTHTDRQMCTRLCTHPRPHTRTHARRHSHAHLRRRTNAHKQAPTHHQYKHIYHQHTQHTLFLLFEHCISLYRVLMACKYTKPHAPKRRRNLSLGFPSGSEPIPFNASCTHSEPGVTGSNCTG